MKTIKPQKREKEWSNNRFESNSKLLISSNLLFFILTSTVSVILLIKLDDMLKLLQKEPFYLMFICFPVLSIVFSYLTLRGVIGKIINGQCVLNLDPFPGAIGGQVGGRIKTNREFHADLNFKITLKCINIKKVSNSNSQSSNASTLWEEVSYCIGKKQKEGAFFDFCFDVPKTLPESSTDSYKGSYNCWSIEASCNQKGFYFNRNYTIPVIKTAKPLDSKFDSSDIKQLTEEAIKSELIADANLKQQNDTIKTRFYGFKRVKVWFGLLLFGLLFTLFYFSNAPLELRAIFSFIGVVAWSISLYLMGKTLSVSVSPEDIIAHRSVFGFPIKTDRMSKQSFYYFRREVDKNVGNIYYKLFACEKPRVEFIVAEGIKNKQQVNEIQKLYESIIKNS